MSQFQRGCLVLEDGENPEGLAFPGELIGAEFLNYENFVGHGEAVFNTSLTGYQEILTDPSYAGQLVVFTQPHIGNTGVNEEDWESSRPLCSGLVVEELCLKPSNWRKTRSLVDWLRHHRLPAITGVNTRALTRHLRSQGVTRAMLLLESDRHRFRELIARLPSPAAQDWLSRVAPPDTERFVPAKNPGQSPFRVVALDFGIKENLLRLLSSAGCDITVLPATSSLEKIQSLQPDGVFLSNGPGDPSMAEGPVKTVRELLGQVPIFGVCMGHQVLGLALGGRTYKLKFGHRGGNQPVLEKNTGRVLITSQNHGYAVDMASLGSAARITYLHLNDRTVSGLESTWSGAPAFSVQFHPEASPGPHDAAGLIQSFVAAMATNRQATPQGLNRDWRQSTLTLAQPHTH